MLNSKTYKYFLIVLIQFFIISFSSIDVHADNGDINVQVNEKILTFDTPPLIYENRTLVPLRAIFEALGAELFWDDSTKTVTGKKDTTSIILKIDSKAAKINGKDFELDVPAMISNGRTMVPARFIAESLGAKVDWNDASKTVIIASSNFRLIQDLNLEKAIRDTIKKPEGILTINDINKITAFTATNKGIQSVDGLQYMTSLTKLYLGMNQIADLTPIGKLSNLTTLSLNNNQFTDITPLSDLSKLRLLNLYGNALVNLNPLKKLTALTDFYFEDTKTKSPLNATYFELYENSYNIANNIIKTVIKPDMSELEKELALHDFIVTYSKYDIENLNNDTVPDVSHTAYGILVNKTGVCDGYSKTMQILLNMVGIECYRVDAASLSKDYSKWGHSWNLVRINGQYYQLDATWDDPSYEGAKSALLHKYFNVSNDQISSNHHYSHNKSPYMFSPSKALLEKSNIDSELFKRYLDNNSNTIITPDNYFYINSGYLYKINRSDYSLLKLGEMKVQRINYADGYIIFSNISDDNKIYRIRTDGTGLEKVYDEKAQGLTLYNNNLYYINMNSKDNFLYKISADGKGTRQKLTFEITSTFNIINDNIFYKSYAFNRGSRLTSIALDGNSSKIITENLVGFTYLNNSVSWTYGKNEQFVDGWVYFVSQNDNKLYKVKYDGTSKIKISDDKLAETDKNSYTFEIYKNWIYYTNFDDKKYYRINTDGTGKLLVNPDLLQ